MAFTSPAPIKVQTASDESGADRLDVLELAFCAALVELPKTDSSSAPASPTA
jgi:hypothetical protein